MPKKSEWQKMVQTPLNQVLDTRSRPPEIIQGGFRYKLNMAINSSGKLCRRDGHAQLSLGSESANWDHHRRDATRYPITKIHENTSPEGVRQLFDATEKKISLLDNATGEWSVLADGLTGGNWRIASLRDKVLFTNNADEPLLYTLGDVSAAVIPELQAAGNVVGGAIRKAKVVIQFAGVEVLMNIEQDDGVGGTERFSSRIAWSNYNEADGWVNGGGGDVASYQDLDYGEEILNAVEFGGVIWIFTDRSIWKMFIQQSGTQVFGFNRWYSEPKNRTACLAYENALVSTGKELLWFGRQTIYWANQFSATPISPDWLSKASGLVFEGDDRIDSVYCESPVADFLPDALGAAKEVWFSYPTISTTADAYGINNWSLVISFDIDSTTSHYQTADYVDHGYTAFGRFSTNEEGDCKGAPVFIGASGTDYCLKQIGGVYYREMVTLLDGDPYIDIPDAGVILVRSGYYSIVRGMCPFGYPSNDKIVRDLLLDHDTIGDDSLLLQLRIGNSATVQDPNKLDGNCRVLWHTIDTAPLACGYVLSPEELEAEGMRSDEGDATAWPMEEIGRYLYFEIKIINSAGTPPVGGNTAWASFIWDYMLKP